MLERRSVLRLVLCGIVAASLIGTGSAGAEPDRSPRAACHDVSLPVALGPGRSADQKIVGEFCAPRDRHVDTVQLLVHGGSYNHLYWDFPYDSPKYSYVDAATRAGYAVLAIDRIGDGDSSHPLSNRIVFPSTIWSLHQVVGALRNGTLGTRFEHVIEVGHSFGSAYAVDQQVTYGDADALVLTGYGHRLSPAFVAESRSTSYPANDDPAFASHGLDGGYLTSKPGTRGSFYYAPGVDPKIIALDERYKDTIETAELSSRPDTGALTPAIRVPTLIVDGRNDTHYCASDDDDCSTQRSFYEAESSYFAAAACLRTMVLPNTGHDVALHYSAPLSDRVILGWAAHVVAPNGGAWPCHEAGPITDLPDHN